jgi:hypothetical protein
MVTLYNLRICIAASPPLSSPHNDGWRVEHFIPLVVDPDCGEALATFMAVIVNGGVSQKIAYLLSSATLVILLKKDAETMEEMELVLRDAYVLPHRSKGMGFSLVKLVSNCALLLLRGSLGAAVGPSQLGVETKGGCDLLLRALQLAMELDRTLAAANLDGINAFGEIERVCFCAALEANNHSLHMLIPLFEMLY